MSPLEGFALMVSVLGGREYSRVTASERDGRGGLGYVSHGMLREGLSERWTGQQGKLEQRPEEAREGSVSPPPPRGKRLPGEGSGQGKGPGPSGVRIIKKETSQRLMWLR